MSEQKFRVGDRVRVKPGGHYYCKYNDPYENSRDFLSENFSDDKELTINNCRYSHVNNRFWYTCEDDGNWVSEDGLELIPQGKPYTINGKTYYAFPEGKNIKELEIDQKRKFIVVSRSTFDVGEILTLHRDDNSENPYFENSEDEINAISLCFLAYYDEEVEEEKSPIEKTVDIRYNAIQDNLRMAVNPIYLGADYSNNNLTPSGNKFMSNIVKFAKDAALAVSNPDEKLRREVGLKDEKGNWTRDAREIVIELESQELGYKNFEELCRVVGVEVGCVFSTAFELHALFVKYDAKLLEIAKAKKAEDKK